MNAVYETKERAIRVWGRMTVEQYERCCGLAHCRPGPRHDAPAERHRFDVPTDEDLFALTNYLVEQRLPHSIATTREWRP